MQDTVSYRDAGQPERLARSILAAGSNAGRSPSIEEGIVTPAAALGGRSMKKRTEQPAEQTWSDHPLVLGLLVGFALGVFVAVMNL